MERLCKELEDMKLVVESLTEECRAKTVISENLKRVNSEQLSKLKETREEIERHLRDIDSKDEEISAAKQMYEELKSKFAEKESALKQLSYANETIKTGFVEKMKKLEGENEKLVLALDEANMKGKELDRVTGSCKKEIEKLKSHLSLAQKKCIDAEQSVKAPKEVKRRDEMIARLEHDKGEVEEQLKWRSEQFRHLEEAHEKNQEKFRSCKKEWERERAKLVDELSSLQITLDSQTRVVEDLRSKLKMCNQALAHEESRRKMLEVQMSESKALYENVMSEYEDTRHNITSLSVRDEEIAELRNLLATKLTLAKELEFRINHLEQENEELCSSLKELQDAQIIGASASSSLKTLQQKFRALEQAHRSCSEKLKSWKAEWNSERVKLSNELDDSLLKLSKKEKQLQHMQAELQATCSELMHQKMENAENSVVLFIMKSKFTEICSNVEDFKCKSEQYIQKTEERISPLVEQLEKKTSELAQARDEIKREHEMVDSVLWKAEQSNSVEKEYILMQKEIVSYKELVDDLSKKLEQLKLQVIHKEFEQSDEIKRNLVALDQANSSLSEKSKRLFKLEFELEQSKLLFEKMEKVKCDLDAELKKVCDERDLMRNQLEETLLAKMETEKLLEVRNVVFLQTLQEKDKKIENLLQHLVVIEEDKHALEASFQAKLESVMSVEKEAQTFVKFAEEIDKRLKSTQTEVDFLIENYVLREIDFVIKFDKERSRFEKVIQKTENVNSGMHKKISLYEQEIIAAFIKQRDVQNEICALNYALEKSMADHVLDKYEIYYQNNLIAELEEEINYLQLKAEEDKMLSIEILTILEEEKNMLEQKSLSNELEFSKCAEIAASIRDAQMELYTLNEVLEKTLVVYVLDKQEIYYKDYLVAELEEEINYLQLKVEEEKMSTEILIQIENEKMRFQEVREEKENVIADMRWKLLSFEQEFSASLIKQRDAYILYNQEICYKNNLVSELEEEIHCLQRIVKFEEARSLGLKIHVNEIEAKLAKVLLEKENERRSLLSERSNLETLKSEKNSLNELIKKLSSDKEDVTSQLIWFANMIGDISDKSEETQRKWDRILQLATHDNDTPREVVEEDQFSSKKIGTKILDLPSRTRRSPLKEQNC